LKGKNGVEEEKALLQDISDLIMVSTRESFPLMGKDGRTQEDLL